MPDGQDGEEWDMNAPTVLAFADDPADRAWIARVVLHLGGRLLAVLPLEGAAEALELRVAETVVVDARDDPGAALDALLAAVDAGVARKRFAAVVNVATPLIDAAAAALRQPEVTLLAAASELERIAAIGLALSGRGGEVRASLRDVASEAETPRLQQLSEEVARIARALATLAQVEQHRPPAGPTPSLEPGEEEGGDPADAQQLRTIIRMRRLRDHFFPQEIFADPAWDMLLDLFAARLEQRRVAVSSLCIAAAVPPTTALRWIKTLTDKGLLVRIADPSDGRRVFIELSEGAARGMTRFLTTMQRVGPLPI